MYNVFLHGGSSVEVFICSFFSFFNQLTYVWVYSIFIQSFLPESLTSIFKCFPSLTRLYQAPLSLSSQNYTTHTHIMNRVVHTPFFFLLYNKVFNLKLPWLHCDPEHHLSFIPVEVVAGGSIWSWWRGLHS